MTVPSLAQFHTVVVSSVTSDTSSGVPLTNSINPCAVETDPYPSRVSTTTGMTRAVRR
jgi:hypothetical protein